MSVCATVSAVPESPTQSIALIGMMGAGKSTVGRLLANKLSRKFLDSDAEVEARTGMTVAQIFDAHGEKAFRDLEELVVRDALHTEDPVVTGVAGGAVLRESTQQLLHERAFVVWLDAPIEVLIDRVSRRRAMRPLIKEDPDVAMRELYAKRRPVYDSLADVVVDVVNETPGRITTKVLESYSGEVRQ